MNIVKITESYNGNYYYYWAGVWFKQINVHYLVSSKPSLSYTNIRYNVNQQKLNS